MRNLKSPIRENGQTVRTKLCEGVRPRPKTLRSRYQRRLSKFCMWWLRVDLVTYCFVRRPFTFSCPFSSDHSLQELACVQIFSETYMTPSISCSTFRSWPKYESILDSSRTEREDCLILEGRSSSTSHSISTSFGLNCHFLTESILSFIFLTLSLLKKKEKPRSISLKIFQ